MSRCRRISKQTTKKFTDISPRLVRQRFENELSCELVADIFSKVKRSALMSRIRSHGNAATELRFITLLKGAGIIGWRRQHRLHGKPDFVFLKFRLAVFVDGCFWHGCPRCYGEPKS